MTDTKPELGASGGGRVLVVDDDAAVGNAIRIALRPRAVTFAQSAVGALARIAAGGKFDAVVCDVNMPGMSGIEFHAEVARIAPALAERIVFITGGAATEEAAAFLARHPIACVMKPFARETLCAAVADASRHAA